MKLSVIFVCALVAFGLACNVNATTTFVGQFATPNQNPDSVLAVATSVGVDPDAVLLSAGRLTTASPTVTNAFGTFTLTVTNTASGPEEFLTFSMNPGFVLAGAAIHAGNGNSDNFYSVNDEMSGVLEGPFNGPVSRSGMFAGLGNFDIFVADPPAAPAQPTPDAGTTVLLFGCSLTGLLALRRYLAS